MAEFSFKLETEALSLDLEKKIHINKQVYASFVVLTYYFMGLLHQHDCPHCDMQKTDQRDDA